MTNRNEIHSDLPIPPGEYLEEVIAELGMSKDELAKRMNRPAAKLSAIFGGEKSITPETALQLERVVGVPAHIWTGLEAEYQLALARLHKANEQQRLKEESVLVPKFCYNELAKFGYVSTQNNRIEKVIELQRFFGVTSLHSVLVLKRYQTAFRAAKVERSPEAIATWLRIGEIIGQKTMCAPFHASALEKAALELRALTLLHPQEFQPELLKRLSDAGVVLVISPHLPKTYAHGATFFLNQEKAVLMLTIRGSWADIFWFSLFHEIKHILSHLGKRNQIILESEEFDSENQKWESEANQFAADTLIPPEAYKSFVAAGAFFQNDIQHFAHQIGIHEGIIVGRLQHDGHIQISWNNQLRARYKWDYRKK